MKKDDNVKVIKGKHKYGEIGTIKAINYPTDSQPYAVLFLDGTTSYFDEDSLEIFTPMTEKEWLKLSDGDKNLWIGTNFFDYEAGVDYKNSYNHWQGFGMIVEKCYDFKLYNVRTTEEGDGVVVFLRGSSEEKRYNAFAPTPWEAAALAYGKAKGLIKC